MPEPVGDAESHPGAASKGSDTTRLCHPSARRRIAPTRKRRIVWRAGPACECSECQGKGAVLAVVDEECLLEKVSTNQGHDGQRRLVRSEVHAHPPGNMDVPS